MSKELTPGQFLASILVPQFSRDTGHICWDCKHFKRVLKGSKYPPADTIGWCTMIHWPFYWCVTDFNVVKKCYAFEEGAYEVYNPRRHAPRYVCEKGHVYYPPDVPEVCEVNGTPIRPA